jgi:regulator of sigma E protease
MFDTFLRSLLAFAVVLGTLIVFHEAGHFLVAKLLRFKVDVFSVGFGRRLWGFRRKETDYRISLIPLGGYVRVVGLVDESVLTEGEQEGPPPPEEPPRRLAKIAIFCAGPLANALLAVVILGFAYMLGRDVPAYLEQPVVAAWVVPGSPAAKAGVLPGDRVIGIGKKEVATWDEYQMEVLTSGGRTLDFRFRRAGETDPRQVPITLEKIGSMDVGRTGIVPFVPVRVIDVLADSPAEAAGMKKGDVILSIEAEPLTPFRDVSSIVAVRGGLPTRFEIRRGGIPMELVITPKASGAKAMIGIQLRFEEMVMRRLGPVDAFVESIRVNADMTVKTLEIIGKLFRREAPLKQMSGPLEIARFAGQESKQGLASFLSFMAMVSLQLFIFNALPIPLLDGFHIVLVAIEGIIRRDFPMRIKERIFQVGFALLVALMLFVLYFDLVKSAAGIKKIFGG